MKKTFNQTMPCAVRLAALLLVPAVCVAFSGCSAVRGSSGSSAAEPSPSPAAAEPAAKPDLPSLRPLYQGDENGYYTFMTAASGDYQQVLYADYQTGTQAPACHITGCTHDSPSCPACFFTGVPVTLPCPVGDGTYLSFVYGYDSDGMSIVRLNQDYGVEQVLYHCNYISSFYCCTDGSSLWFSTCPSGDSYDRIKRLDLSTGGITTLFDAGDTSGQSANIIGCTGRQLVVSVSPYYDSSEPQTSCLYLVDADTGAAELLREYPITNASAGRTTNISAAVLDDTLYEYDYTTGELTATGLADRQTRTVTDALPPDPYEGRGAFDVTITRILNGQLVVEYYSNDWTDDNAETKTPVYLVDLAAGTVAEKPALPPLNWNGYDHTSTTILAQLQDRLLVLCRAEPYTRTTTGTDGAPYTILILPPLFWADLVCRLPDRHPELYRGWDAGLSRVFYSNLCSFPVLWQLSLAALDFTHQNLYNKIKYYRFCGKEVRSWISPANTASIPCAYRAAIPPATANPARFPLCRAPLSNMIAPTIWANCLTCRPAVIFIPACKTPPAIPSPPRLPNWRAALPVC